MTRSSLGLLAVALYGAGLVIHNSFLASYGIYDFDLLKVRYIAAGTAFVAATTATVAFLSIKTDLSYIGNTLSSRQKLLPLILRASCIPPPFLRHDIWYVTAYRSSC